jgi:small-conductance mechanosensitive channel
MSEVTQDETERDEPTDASESAESPLPAERYIRLWGVISFVTIAVWLWALSGAAEAGSGPALLSLGAKVGAAMLLTFVWHGIRSFSGETSWLYRIGVPLYLISTVLAFDIVGLPMFLLLGLGIGGLVVAWQGKSKTDEHEEG